MMADGDGVVHWWKEPPPGQPRPEYVSLWMGGPIIPAPGGGTVSPRVEPPQQWIKQGQGSRGADAARFLLAPPAIQLVELNSRVGELAWARGWNPCKLTHEQRRLLVDEVMATVPRRPPPEPVKPRPLTATEQHAVDLMREAHAAASGTREYSEGTPGIGAARFDHPRHGW
jgi:hypothetical protein